jgi:hypothetical protein
MSKARCVRNAPPSGLEPVGFSIHRSASISVAGSKHGCAHLPALRRALDEHVAANNVSTVRQDEPVIAT